MYVIHIISLYNDNTYVAKFGFTQAGGTYEPNVGLIPDGTTEFHIFEDEYTGNYALIHDGASISFDDTGYFDFELSEDVLEITGQNGGTYLYHRSGTVDKAGTYQLCELNGIPANQLGEKEILELREDHMVTVHCYSPDGATIGKSAPLIMGFTWKLEDGELLISDNRIPMEAELNDNGFTLVSRFGEMADEKVYKLVGSD